jgi:RsiW-degrading membrane proteinase PrsW (M82 family)
MPQIPGIYLTAIITMAAAIAVFGTLADKLRPPADERLLWLAALIVLPLQPLAFYCVRLPFDHWVVAHLGAKSAAYFWLRTFYAPLTEEPAKLIPLLIPAIRRDIRPENFARYALAIGLGFAIGEMGFVAERVARSPQFAHLPFYQFGGYVSERLMTCVFHSAFVALALWRLRRKFILGFACAAAGHWLGNFPLVLMDPHIGHLSKVARIAIVQGWLMCYFLAALALLSWFCLGRFNPTALLFDPRHCPECEKDYDPPLFAVNFGTKRYERCPHCRRWHWTGPADSTRHDQKEK